MTDLLIATHTPALDSGRSLRTYGLARALAREPGLDLLYARFGVPHPDEAFRSIAGLTMHEAVPSRGVRRLGSYGLARAQGVPAAFARGVSPELLAAARELADEPGRGRVVADGPVAAAALRSLALRRPVIYNAHNIESDFRHELSGGGLGSERRLRAFERGLLARSSESWIVSRADMAQARALCPRARLRYVPNVVDVRAIRPVDPVAEPRAIFVASFTYEPNRRALRFLLEEVFPRVWRQLPQARLILVGAGLEEPPSEDERVEILGFVESLATAYRRAACAVVPLLQGGGSPLKLIEALAYGLPVVATPRAVAGLELADREHCRIASGPQAFADALLDVLGDGAPEMAARGRAIAERRYSIEALGDLLAGDVQRP